MGERQKLALSREGQNQPTLVMGQFRESSIYIHRKTLRRLWWLSRVLDMVPDAIADKYINERIEADYGEWFKEAEADVKGAEAKFAKRFGKTAEEVALD